MSLSQKHTRIIAVANQKGGVGKTTTCVNLAAALVEQGKRVLLVDNDPQANLTSYLTKQKAAHPPAGTKTLTIDALYLMRRAPDRDQAETDFVNAYSAGFYYIAADSELSAVESYLYAKSERETVLKNNLKWAEGVYDFIFIDNPPSVNLLTLNALVAAHEVLIPLQTEFFSDIRSVMKFRIKKCIIYAAINYFRFRRVYALLQHIFFCRSGYRNIHVKI